MKKIILILIIFFLINVYSTLADNITIHTRPLSSGAIQPNSNFAYVFNFTTDVDCTNVLLNISKDITTDSYGVGYADLDISNLTENPSYLCEYRNGTLRKTHTINAGLFSSIIADDIGIKSKPKDDFNLNGTGSAYLFKINETDVFYKQSQLTDILNNTYIVTEYLNNKTFRLVADDRNISEGAVQVMDIYNSTEELQDLTGAMVTGNTETLISVDYQDADGTIDFVIPYAIPSDGDTTHLSTADQIYDYIVSLNYVAKLSVDTDYYNKTISDYNLTTGLAKYDQCSEITNCVANAWDADGDISADEISESKINFVTACAAGNHYYLSGNDLACEADDDTTYTADEENITLSGTQFKFIGDFIKATQSFGGEISGIYGNIVLAHDALDDQYYDSESDLTTLLDDNYKPINTAGGNTTSEIFDVCNNETFLDKADGLDTANITSGELNIARIPTASPSDGDTTHTSTADHIYDWVIGLSYLTTTTGDERYITEDTADTMNADLHIGTSYASGGMTLYSSTYDLFTTGDMIVGDLIGLQTINISSHIIPYKTDLFDIGNKTYKYRNASFSGTVDASSVTIDGGEISGWLVYDTYTITSEFYYNITNLPSKNVWKLQGYITSDTHVGSDFGLRLNHTKGASDYVSYVRSDSAVTIVTGTYLFLIDTETDPAGNSYPFEVTIYNKFGNHTKTHIDGFSSGVSNKFQSGYWLNPSVIDTISILDGSGTDKFSGEVSLLYWNEW